MQKETVGAKNWSSEIVDVGGSKCTSPSLLLVDQSSRDSFSLNEEESLSIFQILDILIRS